MRLTNILLITALTAFCFSLQTLAFCQAQPATSWTLPQGLKVKDSAPRTYKFIVDYNSANSRGEIFDRQQLTGEYTRGLPNGEVMWKNVTTATVQGPTAPYPAPQKIDFMEGLRYGPGSNVMAPDFFKGFPPSAIMEKNLVWDTVMIETFGQEYFDHLKLNEPYHAMSKSDINMPGIGTFQNRDVVLRWIGRSQRNGQDCAVILYQAFFNPLNISTPGVVDLKGRSDYWGEIWVSLSTKQIEYATLYENVAAEMKLPNQNAPQVINVLRVGTFEPITK